MAKVFNRILGGGGSGGASANIYVTGLSQTDTCTMRTPSGKVVNGEWGEVQGENCYTFHATEYGMHTITASNGTKTSTEEVLVDALMDYWVEIILGRLYLYKYGDERESVTGGWSKFYNINGGDGTFSPNIDSFYMKGSTNTNMGECGCITTNKISTVGYTKLCGITSDSSGTTYNINKQLCLFTSNVNPYYHTTGKIVIEQVGAIDGEMSGALSDYQGEYWVALQAFPKASTRFDAVWLE